MSFISVACRVYPFSSSRAQAVSDLFENVGTISPFATVAYGWSSDILGFVIEKVSGVTLEQFLYAPFDINECVNRTLKIAHFFSQENIFKPLGVKASFYLTPDLKEKHVDLSFRTEGTLEAGLHRASKQIMEQDPEKCGHQASLSLIFNAD